MKFSSLISLFSTIILAHSPSSLPPLLWGSHVQLVHSGLWEALLFACLSWQVSYAQRLEWGRDNSRLCLLRQAKTEARHQLFLSWKKPVRAFFQLLGVFLLLFWAERKQQQGEWSWFMTPRGQLAPIYEEIHLIWLHTSLTAVKEVGFGFGFCFWCVFVFFKETLHVNAKKHCLSKQSPWRPRAFFYVITSLTWRFWVDTLCEHEPLRTPGFCR